MHQHKHATMSCYVPALHRSGTPLLRLFSFQFHGAAVAADEDEAVGLFFLVAGAIAFGQEAPGRSELLPAAAGFGFACAAAVGVIDRIAGNTAIDRANAEMARTASFA